MIDLRVRKTFPARPDSRAFTLDLAFRTEAGVTVLFGPSGAGKTLTLDAIAGFVTPDDGRILVDDALLYDSGSGLRLAPRARRCGYVFQNYALFPHLTLRENLNFAAERLPRLERRRRVNETLDRFHLNEVSGRRPHELSGGQKQRGSIARALLAAPRVLLLDEPARGLDPSLRQELYDVLRKVRGEYSTPVLLVTHDLDECLELGEWMVVLDDGAIAQQGRPLDVLEEPLSARVAQLLGRYHLLPAEVIALDPAARRSRLRLDLRPASLEISGPYFPGHLLGDRVTLAVRPEQIKAAPGAGLMLERAVDAPAGVRLEFRGGLTVEMTRAEYAPHRERKEWALVFPPEALRIVK
jgi:molybdate transport system ATP-binding protein